MTSSSVGQSVRVDSLGRRSFSAADKQRIVAEYLAAGNQTEKGEVLRRWGTFHPNVSRWKSQINKGTLGSKAKGPKPASTKALGEKLRRSEAKLVKAKDRIATLEELVVAQGKVLGLHAKNADSPHSK